MIMTRRKTNYAKVIKEAGNSNGGSIPSFDEKALSVLTAKIEKGFGAGKSKQPGDLKRGKKESNGTNNQRSAKAQSKTKPVEHARGIKRDSRGNAKVAGGGEPPTKQRNEKSNDDRAVLLKEILALGGTEEDLDLVVDAVLDEEDDDSNEVLPDKSFRKELANFVAGLGIEGELDEVSSGGSEKEDTNDGWEDASDVNGSVDGGEDVKALIPDPLQAPSEDPKRLVSTT
jgi:ribosome biogenesis protein MAK21